MSYILVIVESPAKCKKIESFLGKGYKCVASFGHIRELNGLKSINILNNFELSFIESESKKANIIKLKKMAKEAKEVIIATDDDREGEAIGWHLCEVLDLPNTTQRIIFHEITKTAILEAIRNPNKINYNMVDSQKARQVLDLLVGYKMSPVLWKNFASGHKSNLSAGRCQTPALRIIYENQKEIDESPGKMVYNTIGYFTSKNLPFTLDHQYEDNESMVNFLEETVNHSHIYTCGDERKNIKNPPRPFTTSALQQAASSELRINTKETMKICQKLYESGYITYMRTDSRTYSEEFINKTKAYILKNYEEQYINPIIDSLSLSYKKNNNNNEGIKESKKAVSKKEENKTAQEAHEAIRPTDINLKDLDNDDSMSAKERKMYYLIWRNTLESCMSAAIYKGITAKITSAENHNFKSTQEQVVFPGWKIVDGFEKENVDYIYLQKFKNGSVVQYKKLTCKASLKGTKDHYTEAKLVQLLEEKGIGRPSTFATLVEKIQERDYVKKEDVAGKLVKCVEFELEGEEIIETEVERELGSEKNKLVLQPLGKMVWDFLQQNYLPLFEYGYTKHMEDSLDIIAKGGKIWYELCKECNSEVDSLISKDTSNQPLQEGGKKQKAGEIKIDEEHIYTNAKYGPVVVSVIDGKKVFKPARKDIDIDKLKRGEYRVDEIIDTKKSELTNGKNLGKYQNYDLILKKGKFGFYVEYGDIKKSLNLLGKSESKMTYKNIIELLDKGDNANPSVLRVVNNNMSIRKGKFGNYIYYKTNEMNKPTFLSLSGFNENAVKCNLEVLCAWIETKHNIDFSDLSD
jgi:DNA topoisomerase-1